MHFLDLLFLPRDMTLSQESGLRKSFAMLWRPRLDFFTAFLMLIVLFDRSAEISSRHTPSALFPKSEMEVLMDFRTCEISI